VTRNGRGLCPTLHVTVSATRGAPPDVTRNGKCAAHVSCISFGAAFGRCIEAREPRWPRGGVPKVQKLRGGQLAK
jgi:hypothetical protein